MNPRSVFFALFITIPVLAGGVCNSGQAAVKIRSETLEAFNQYENTWIQEFFTGVGERGHPRVILDDADARIRVRGGTILVVKGTRTPKIPGGILHEWIGAMFIPDVTIDAVTQLLTDYDHHAEYYPEVMESRVLRRECSKILGFLRLKKKKVLTVVLNTEHEMNVYPREGKFQHLVSLSKRIQEVKNPGKPDEHELPVGEDSGFLWRMDAGWVLEQCNDGVMVECSTLSLSRDIPRGLGWMIRPFIESMPRTTLEATLQVTRLVVKKLAQKP